MYGAEKIAKNANGIAKKKCKKCNESVIMRKKTVREGEVIILEVGGGQRTCLMERTLRALRLRCRRKFGDISCFLPFLHHLWKLGVCVFPFWF